MKTQALTKKEKEILWADYRDNSGSCRNLSVTWTDKEYMNFLNSCYTVLSNAADSYEGEEKENLIAWSKIFLNRFAEVYQRRLVSSIDRTTMAQAEYLVLQFVG